MMSSSTALRGSNTRYGSVCAFKIPPSARCSRPRVGSGSALLLLMAQERALSSSSSLITTSSRITTEREMRADTCLFAPVL